MIDGVEVFGIDRPLRPVALVEFAHGGAQTRRRHFGAPGFELGGEERTQQQRQLPVDATAGEARVGQLPLRIDERGAFGPVLGAQPGRLLDRAGQVRGPLREEVGALVLAQLVDVDDRVLDEAAGERTPDTRAAALGGRRVLALVDQVG